MKCNNCGTDFKPSDLNQYMCDSCLQQYNWSESNNDNSDKGVKTFDYVESLRGTVKWFSRDKGYGFIVGRDNQERYFHIKDIDGTVLPDNGDTVGFESAESDKGLKAVNVKILHASRNSNRVACNHCGKEMVPRIITGLPLIRFFGDMTPVAIKSICPFCGSDHQQFRRSFF